MPSTPKTAVSTDQAPAPAHTFSQGVRRGPILQVSGQGPVDPATNAYLYLGDVRAQTERTLANVEAILGAGGATFDDVVMLRVYLTTRDDFAPMNEAYGDYLASRCTPDGQSLLEYDPDSSAVLSCLGGVRIILGSALAASVSCKPHFMG